MNTLLHWHAYGSQSVLNTIDKLCSNDLHQSDIGEVNVKDFEAVRTILRVKKLTAMNSKLTKSY